MKHFFVQHMAITSTVVKPMTVLLKTRCIAGWNPAPVDDGLSHDVLWWCRISDITQISCQRMHKGHVMSFFYGREDIEREVITFQSMIYWRTLEV